MKLNLGCGANFMPDFLNVDKVRPHPMPVGDFLRRNLDMLVAWPWRESEITEVQMIHSLEHMGQRTVAFRNIITELYRVCCDGAKIFIVVPHPRHNDFLNDPTHVRPITPEIMRLFSQRYNLEQRKSGASDSALALAWGVDFELEDSRAILDPSVDQNLPPQELDQLAMGLNNVIKEYHITLRVVKGLVGHA